MNIAASGPTSPSLHRQRALDQDQLDHFRTQGFLRIGPLLDDELVQSLGDEYDRVFAEARATERYRDLSKKDDADSDEEMLQIMQMCERSLPFRHLAYHEAILDIVQDLIGPTIQLFHDQALFKPAHTGGPIHWHQDNAYWQCVPADLVSCWLTLDDVDAANGAMHVLPGSHRKAVEHTRGDVLLDAGDEVDTSAAVVVDLPAGGVMFHHCQTFHFTPPNRTDRQRRAFAMHFMGPGTRSIRNGEMPVSFARPLLRLGAGRI